MTPLFLSWMLMCTQFLCYKPTILENPLAYSIAVSRKFALAPLPPREEEIPKLVVETKPHKEDVVWLIKYYSKKYEYNEEVALKIAGCESGYRANAKNPNSSASWVYQHLRRYWDARAKKYWFPGASVFDAEANVAVSIQMLKNESTRPRYPSKHCWNK